MGESNYARLIKALATEDKQLDNIGTVVSTNPLVIKIGDLEIDKDNIMINPSLLTRDIFITTDILVEGDTGSDGDPSHSHNFNKNLKLNKHRVNINSELKVNDEVLILRNGQLFIVVCKVVSI